MDKFCCTLLMRFTLAIVAVGAGVGVGEFETFDGRWCSKVGDEIGD